MSAAAWIGLGLAWLAGSTLLGVLVGGILRRLGRHDRKGAGQ